MKKTHINTLNQWAKYAFRNRICFYPAAGRRGILSTWPTVGDAQGACAATGLASARRAWEKGTNGLVFGPALRRKFKAL